MDFIEKLKALIEKLKAIGDAIRDRTGTTDEMTLDEMAEVIKSMEVSGGDDTNTYILVDENGNEVPAVLVDEPVMLTANAVTDIRKGMTAVTDEGIVTGEKEIPAYITTEGRVLVSPGATLTINMYTDDYRYTRLQALICEYNTTIANSVSTIMIVTGDKVYDVKSTVEKATVTVDHEKQSINFGIANNSDDYLVIRYFTYRED